MREISNLLIILQCQISDKVEKKFMNNNNNNNNNINNNNFQSQTFKSPGLRFMFYSLSFVDLRNPGN
jgi:hypothetical protein